MKTKQKDFSTIVVSVCFGFECFLLFVFISVFAFVHLFAYFDLFPFLGAWSCQGSAGRGI